MTKNKTVLKRSVLHLGRVKTLLRLCAYLQLFLGGGEGGDDDGDDDDDDGDDDDDDDYWAHNCLNEL